MITPELIQRVKNKIKTSRAAYEHFFNSLSDPAWIAPLVEAGFFKNPEPLIKQDGYVSFPFWPESQYLLRMVDKAPDEVLEVVKHIPDTDSQRVLEDILGILLKVSPDQAVRFTDRVVKFTDTPYQLRLPDLAGQLAAKLAEAGHVKPAVKIANALLDVQPDPKHEKMSREELEWAMFDPQIKYRDYDYQEIAKKVVKALGPMDPLASISLFGDLLDKTIRYKLLQYTEAEVDDDESDWEDYSSIWRPNLEDSGRSYEQQPRHGLVSSLRDSIYALMESELTDAEKLKALQGVCARKFTVYKRIVEYVLRDYKDKEPFRALYNELFEKLNPITDPAKLDSYEMQEFTPNAGITLEELTALSDVDLIEKLKTYKPSEFGFQREAMADQVTALIKSSPKRYLKIADQILEVKDRYVHSLFSGIVDVVDDLDEGDIKAALDFARAFIEKEAPEENENEDNRYYGWTMMAITRFLNKIAGQKQDKTEYMSEPTAKQALGLILDLARNSDPTEEQEKEYGGENMDPSTLSVNTTRGEALHSLAQMIRWTKRNNPKEDFLPRIYTELEWHLDLANDPSRAIRAVYGQWLPWIWDTDKKWAENNINKIFTQDEHGDTAWGAYVTLNQVFDDVSKFLEPIARQRINTFKNYKKSEQTRVDSRIQFAKHLMVYYWRGLNNLDEDSLTKLFFDSAHVHYRSEAIGFIGFELRKGNPSDPVTIKRLQDLWLYRLAELAAHQEQGVEELEHFGSWFASGVFDEKWSIDTMLTTLKLAGNADPDYAVVERLSELASEFPLESIECLKIMIKGSRERWAIDSWREHATIVLLAAYNSGNEQAKLLATEQANFLVAKGYYVFRDVLKEDI